MAEFDDILGGPSTTGPSTSTDTTNGTATTVRKKAPIINAPTAVGNTIAAETYSDEELADVNNVITTIPDTTTPIVIFFGPSSSGKTMVLLRMIRFFKDEMGFTVQAERTFRPSHDVHYKRMCDNLQMMANDQYAPKPNDAISFMLVKIYDRAGRAVLQILEAPGEHYFDETVPDAPFPAYIEHIIETVPNRKVWVYFVEQDWKDASDRSNYADKITMMQGRTPHDKVVFLFNKCDEQSHMFDNNGHPRTPLFLNTCGQQYPGIFSRYANSGIARFLFGPYRFSAVCFSSGTFSKTNSGRQRWTVGKSFYCKELWKAISNK